MELPSIFFTGNEYRSQRLVLYCDFANPIRRHILSGNRFQRIRRPGIPLPRFTFVSLYRKKNMKKKKPNNNNKKKQVHCRFTVQTTNNNNNNKQQQQERSTPLIRCYCAALCANLDTAVKVKVPSTAQPPPTGQSTETRRLQMPLGETTMIDVVYLEFLGNMRLRREIPVFYSWE